VEVKCGKNCFIAVCFLVFSTVYSMIFIFIFATCSSRSIVYLPFLQLSNHYF